MNSPPEPNPPPIDAALAAYVEQKIDERLGNEHTREFMLAVVGEALGEALNNVRDQTREQRRKEGEQRQQEIDKVEELKALMSRVEAVMERFCRLLEVERSQRQSITDLPTPTRRSEVN